MPNPPACGTRRLHRCRSESEAPPPHGLPSLPRDPKTDDTPPPPRRFPAEESRPKPIEPRFFFSFLPCFFIDFLKEYLISKHSVRKAPIFLDPYVNEAELLKQPKAG